jgi:hypothetical protein
MAQLDILAALMGGQKSGGVDSLFGPTPYDVGQARNQQDMSYAEKVARMGGFEQAKFGIGQGAAGLTRAGAGMMGMVDPLQQDAMRTESILGMGGDLTTPAGLRAKAKQFQDNGDSRTALKLALAAEEMEKSAALTSRYKADGLGLGKIEDPNRVANRNWSAWLDTDAGKRATLDEKENMKSWLFSEAFKDFKSSVAMLQNQDGLAGVKPPMVRPPVAPQPVATMPPPMQAAPVAPTVAPTVSRSTPADFPRVSPTEQLARDEDRLAILNKEVKTFPNDAALAKDLENTARSVARQKQLLGIQTSATAKAKTEGEVVTARVEAENNPDALRRGAAAKKEGDILGESGGKASLALAGSDEMLSEVQRGVNDLLSHKGFKSAVGATLLPGMRFVEGSKEAGFMSRLEQLQGGAFLRAYETLKGGGQITEIEGQKATAAMSRMSKAISEKEFKLATEDFVRAITIGLNKLKAQEALMKRAQATKSAAPTSLENQLAPPPGFKR